MKEHVQIEFFLEKTATETKNKANTFLKEIGSRVKAIRYLTIRDVMVILIEYWC